MLGKVHTVFHGPGDDLVAVEGAKKRVVRLTMSQLGRPRYQSACESLDGELVAVEAGDLPGGVLVGLLGAGAAVFETLDELPQALVAGELEEIAEDSWLKWTVFDERAPVRPR